MALNLVQLNWDITDLVQAGQLATLVIAPTAQLSDATDHVLVPVIPRQVNFYGSGSLAGIVANDNSAITPSGTGYYISVITAGGQVIVPQMQVQILFSNGATQWLDALAPVPSVTTTYQYLPLPSGTPSSGQVPVATGAGETSAWGNVLSNPMTTLGDTLYENAAPAAARLAGNTTATKKFLTQTGTGSVSAAPGWNTIAAGDMPAGTTSAQGALQLDGTAGDIQAIGASAAAGTSGLAADARHVHPNTGLVTIDGTTGDIAAAPGTAAAGATGKAADAGHVHPQPPVLAPTGLTGATAASRYAGATASGAPGSGTFALGDYVIDQAGKVWVCTAAGTPGTWTSLGTVTGVTAADTSVVVGGTAQAPTVRTGTLDVIATQHPAAASWSNNSQKITSLANGSGAQDAAAFGQIPLVEGTVANIKPVSTAAALGSSGKWPDSDHVHLGFFGGIFGNGSDGSVTFDGSTTILGMVPSGSAYTMTRDIQCTNITINNTVTLKTANYRILCQGTLTNNGTINNAGANASGQGGAAFPQGSASFPAGRTGGGGGTGVSGTGANGGAGQIGTAGGNGGAGTSGAAGTGGTVTVTSANASANMLSLPFAALSGVGAFAFQTIDIQFGAGGGGGGSDASSNAGGGGGSSGGVIAIFAWAVNNGGGTITAAGGSGFTVTAGNAGGGGGGSGGAILVYTLSAWTAGTTNVAGGALGSGHGTGSNGQAGGNGLVLNTVLA